MKLTVLPQQLLVAYVYSLLEIETITMLLCLGAVPAHFGEGSESILPNQINCSGNESKLLLCNQEAIQTRSCDHSGDAGVRCRGIYTANYHNWHALLLNTKLDLVANYNFHTVKRELLD